MPTCPIKQVFVSDRGWVQVRYEDGTETIAGRYSLGLVAVMQLAEDMSDLEWIALKTAIKNPNVWVQV